VTEDDRSNKRPEAAQAPFDEQGEAPIDDEILARVSDVSRAFSPGAPITTRDLFSGRVTQMSTLMEVVGRRGGHAVLYGERGVGKTSLAAVVSQVLASQNRITARVNCGAGDTFSTVWGRVFAEISLTIENPPLGFESSPRIESFDAAGLLSEDPVTPDRVRSALGVISGQVPVVVFVDEFDRLHGGESRAPFADLIKSLSDYVVDATVVLVGVADDVDDLVAEHRSIERALEEILMPRMSVQESLQIVQKGLAGIGMLIEQNPLDRIVDLSKGLPHYTHLLAQEAALFALWDRREIVGDMDVTAATESALDKAQQTVKSDYSRATYSPRPHTLHPDVLRACALAPKDDLGFFAPVDVRDPLSRLLGRQVDIPIYQQHLNAFTTESRGEVLQRRGEARRFRYRFRNPLLEPYVILRGLRDDAVKDAG
jgi:Cdc6-like AAA superfamily ATPase